MYDIFYHIPDTNITTLLISISTLIFLIFSKDFLSLALKRRGLTIPLPFELITVVFWTIISGLFNFDKKYNVKTVKEIPTGLVCNFYFILV